MPPHTDIYIFSVGYTLWLLKKKLKGFKIQILMAPLGALFGIWRWRRASRLRNPLLSVLAESSNYCRMSPLWMLFTLSTSSSRMVTIFSLIEKTVGGLTPYRLVKCHLLGWILLEWNFEEQTFEHLTDLRLADLNTSVVGGEKAFNINPF